MKMHLLHQTLKRRDGFSLPELLVTMSIVAVVAGLVIMGVTNMRENAKSSQTRSILAGLNGIAAQYEVKTTKEIHHQGSLYYNWTTQRNFNSKDVDTTQKDVIKGDGETADHANANKYIERFISQVYMIPDLRKTLESLGSEHFTDSDQDGFMEVVDPWGNSIAYASRASFAEIPEDDFLPEYPVPFFASAGEDGEWGSIESTATAEEQAAARDNLYSFDIDRTVNVRED